MVAALQTHGVLATPVLPVLLVQLEQQGPTAMLVLEPQTEARAIPVTLALAALLVPLDQMARLQVFSTQTSPAVLLVRAARLARPVIRATPAALVTLVTTELGATAALAVLPVLLAMQAIPAALATLAAVAAVAVEPICMLMLSIQTLQSHPE
jgi:hypothetical protein